MDQVAGHTSSIFRVPAYRGEAGGGVQALAEGRTGYVSPDRARDPLRSGLLRGVHPGQKQEEEMKTDIANEVFNKIIEYGISNVEFETTEEGERRESFVFNGGQIVKIEVTSKEAHERYINRILYNAKKDLIEKPVSALPEEEGKS